MNRLEQYRIIQERTDHLVVQLVFRGESDHAVLGELHSRSLEGLAEPVRVEMQCLADIRDECPKFRSFISRLSVKEDS